MTDTLEASPLAFEVTALAPERQREVIAARDRYERALRRMIQDGIAAGDSGRRTRRRRSSRSSVPSTGLPGGTGRRGPSVPTSSDGSSRSISSEDSRVAEPARERVMRALQLAEVGAPLVLVEVPGTRPRPRRGGRRSRRLRRLPHRHRVLEGRRADEAAAPAHARSRDRGHGRGGGPGVRGARWPGGDRPRRHPCGTCDLCTSGRATCAARS